MDSSQTSNQVKFISPSGATSSEVRLPYDLIPVPFLRRLAARFRLGSSHHGRGNWVRSFSPPSGPAVRVDLCFLRDRYAHALEHLLLLREGTSRDDHLAAVAWFCCFAMDAEERGVDWRQVLAVGTPEAEAELQATLGLTTEQAISPRV